MHNSTNELINSYFEPKPTDSPEHLYAKRGEYWDWHKDTGWTSRFDYFTDEAANARLLEAMPYPTLEQFLAETPLWSCKAVGLEESQHADRKTAVVMAFCKFAGIAQ